MTTLDISALPKPSLIEDLDYEAIFAEMLERFQALDPSYSAMTESDPVYKILEVAAYFRLLDRQRINEAALATMVAYAADEDLDAVGVRFNVERLVIVEADDSVSPPIKAEYEKDDDFRRRILLALEGISTAGSVGAYQYHALSAHSLVGDVSAIMPKAGTVLVSVLSKQGDGTADQEVLEAVETALSADNVRPLTDEVIVQSARIVKYGGSAALYIEKGPEVELVLSAAQASLDAYTQSQFRLGRNIRRAAIHAALMVTGVQNVVLSDIDDLVINKEQAAYCTGITLTYGGVDA